MTKVKNFKTIFPAVAVPMNADYSINEPAALNGNASSRSALKNAAIS